MWHSSGRLAYGGSCGTCAADGGQALVGTCGTRLDVWPMSVYFGSVPQTVARHWSAHVALVWTFGLCRFILGLCRRRWPGIGQHMWHSSGRLAYVGLFWVCAADGRPALVRHMWHSSGRLAYVGLFWVCAADGGQALVGTCDTCLDVWPMAVYVGTVPQTVARHWSAHVALVWTFGLCRFMLELCRRQWPGIGRHMWHSTGRLAYVGLFWVCAAVIIIVKEDVLLQMKSDITFYVINL